MTRLAAAAATAATAPPAKTVLTDVGAVDLAVPRDRNGTFEPQIVRKGQTRLEGFNDRIIALYARGMTTRDIRAHLREMYDVDVSPDLISRVTDGVLDELAEWQSRPLDAVYPVVFIDALMIKVRDGVVTNRPVYLAIGIDCEGAKQVLGLWVGPTTGESAKFWMSVLSELQEPGRGGRVHRVLRRADRPARCDHGDLAAGGRAAVRGAPDPRHRCGMPPRSTGCHCPAICGLSTPPPTRPPRPRHWRPSPQSGKTATQRS